MAQITSEIKHTLTEKEAVSRIKKLISEAQEQYGNKITKVDEKWIGNTGHFSVTAMGYDVSGTLEVKKDIIVIQATIPWSLGLFKGKIEKIIQEKARALLK